MKERGGPGRWDSPCLGPHAGLWSPCSPLGRTPEPSRWHWADKEAVDSGVQGVWPAWGILGKSLLSVGVSARQRQQRFVLPIDLPVEGKAGGGAWKGVVEALARGVQAASEQVSTAELS